MKKTECTAVLAFLLLAAVPLLAQNPTLVRDINASTDESVQILSGRDVLNGVVYFNGDDGSGKKFWRTDGTAAGTYLLKDIPAQPFIHALNGGVYFIGNDPVNGQDPWISDGTTYGTTPLNTYSLRKSQSKSVKNFCAMGSKVYFVYAIIDVRQSIFTDELWQTDGTTNGTSSVYTLDWIKYLIDGGTKIYLFGADGYYSQGAGEEPWVSDGTASGTNLILDICPINGTGSNHCDVDYVPSTVNPNIFNRYVAYPEVVNGMWYFSKSDGVNGMELWGSDGTANGTSRLTDINPGSASSCPYFMVEMDGTLYFTADDGTNGMELWKYPLPNGPATLVKDIATGSAGSEPIWLTPMNGTLYFSAWTSDGGRELWRSNGTAIGTVQVEDIASGSTSSNPNYDKITDIYHAEKKAWRMFTVLGDKLYFAADDGNGYELWESDGTAAGTTKIADINPNSGEGSSPYYLTPMCDRLLFTAYHPSYGNEWWVYSTGGNQAPVAVVSATPTSGDAPLAVGFSSAGSSDPDGSITGWFWDFGDNNTSAEENPAHVYENSGTYTARLTVTDNCSATATDDVTIIVTGTQSAYVYVAEQTVTRIPLSGGRTAGRSEIIVKDNTGVVLGATVNATYTGPTSGTISGSTDASGYVRLETVSTKKNLNLDWCFTVTDVQLSAYTFNDQIGAPNVCEGTPKKGLQLPASCILHQNAPNPFSTATVIHFSLPETQPIALQVYDLLGRRVATAADGLYDRGAHSVHFQRNGLPAGAYILQLMTGSVVLQQMMCVQ